MMLFTPSSMGEVGDTAKNDYFGICRNDGDVGFGIVTLYAEDPTGTVPTPPFPGSRDRVVRSMVLAGLPHPTGP